MTHFNFFLILPVFPVDKFHFFSIFCNFQNLCLAYNTTLYKLAQSPVKRKKALCLHNFSGAVGKKCPRAQKNLPWQKKGISEHFSASAFGLGLKNLSLMPFFYLGRFFRTLGQFFLPPSLNNYVKKILFLCPLRQKINQNP